MGIWNVDKLLHEISSKQLSEWMAFAQLEPFGFQADMFGHALNATHLINAQRKKGSKAVQPKDLMPTEVQTQTEIRQGFFQSLKEVLYRTKQKGK